MRMLRTLHFKIEQITLHISLSIYGAVARWCKDFGVKSDETPPKTINGEILKEVPPKEMTSWVKAPRHAQPAAGISVREVQQNFETLGTEVQFTRISKEAAFIHEVALGHFYRTALDVDDGFGSNPCMWGIFESS